MLTVHDALAGDAAPSGLAELVQACTAHDGHAPFEEHTLLTLDGGRQVPHARVALTASGRLAGCALLSEGIDGWVVEAAVHPGLRGRGLGRQLLGEVGEHVASHGGGLVRAWVHGHGAAAQALADTAGARVDRRLLVLERPLVDLPADRCQEGTLLRRLDTTDDGDRDAWLALSNAAFTGHPDNGKWTRADLDWRLDAAWTDARRFPVVIDAFGLAAGVWTKSEPGRTVGELYVVAVHPRAQGRRLGRVVVTAALRDLHAAGCHHAVLYVDATNTAALALYTWAGFTTGVEHRCLAAHVSGNANANANANANDYDQERQLRPAPQPRPAPTADPHPQRPVALDQA